jgi:Ulp1 family protease
MYDTLNDRKHAQSASIAMAKLFPNMSGYRVNMVKVQQQEGINDCGLFACAYISLLSNGLDPSQHTFDQRLLRLTFRRFLEGDDNLIEQYRKNLNNETGKETFITL